MTAPALHPLLHPESETIGEPSRETDHWGYEDAKAVSGISPLLPGPKDLHRYVLWTPTPTPREDFATGNLNSHPGTARGSPRPWDPLSIITATALGSRRLLRVNIPPWGSKMTKSSPQSLGPLLSKAQPCSLGRSGMGWSQGPETQVFLLF